MMYITVAYYLMDCVSNSLTRLVISTIDTCSFSPVYICLSCTSHFANSSQPATIEYGIHFLFAYPSCFPILTDPSRYISDGIPAFLSSQRIERYWFSYSLWSLVTSISDGVCLFVLYLPICMSRDKSLDTPILTPTPGSCFSVKYEARLSYLPPEHILPSHSWPSRNVSYIVILL